MSQTTTGISKEQSDKLKFLSECGYWPAKLSMVHLDSKNIELREQVCLEYMGMELIGLVDSKKYEKEVSALMNRLGNWYATTHSSDSSHDLDTSDGDSSHTSDGGTYIPLTVIVRTPLMVTVCLFVMPNKSFLTSMYPPTTGGEKLAKEET